MKEIIFTRGYRGALTREIYYPAGVTASFEDNIARQIVERDAAVYVQADAKVPFVGDDTATVTIGDDEPTRHVITGEPLHVKAGVTHPHDVTWLTAFKYVSDEIAVALIRAGYDDPKVIAAEGPENLAKQISGVGVARAKSIIQQARELV